VSWWEQLFLCAFHYTLRTVRILAGWLRDHLVHYLKDKKVSKEFNFDSSKFNFDSSKFKFDSPKFNFDSPKFNFDSSKFNFDCSKFNFDSSKFNFEGSKPPYKFYFAVFLLNNEQNFLRFIFNES
jgi:hypothetical protein